MKFLGNILWHFPFFGFVQAAIVYIFGALLTLTVVAAPIGLGLMEYGKFLFWPFGHAMIDKKDLNIDQNKLWRAYSFVIKIIYLPFGILFSIALVISVFGLLISIIGIPHALVLAKSLGTYFNPVNKKCVSSSVVLEIERRKAADYVANQWNK
jgi:uncharacterized membrane protein YccF (DUF307 family)